MSGRYERTALIDEKVKDGLQDYPPILMKYFRKSARYQATSRHVMINAIKRFIDYLKNVVKIDVMTDDWYTNVTEETILNYVDHIKVRTCRDGKKKPLSAASIHTTWKYLNNFFGFLVRENYITDNPVEATEEYLQKSKVRRKVVYMTPDEVREVKERIIKHSPEPERDLCIFMLGCRTGLRQSAIIDIDISDIDFKEKSIRVIEKGNVDKDILIDDDTIRLINEYLKVRGDKPDTDALFVKTTLHDECVRINSWDMKVILERSTIDLSKRITPHKMRATCATNLYIETGDIFMVAERLGHYNIENTRRYTDAVGKARQASNIMGNIF